SRADRAQISDRGGRIVVLPAIGKREGESEAVGELFVCANCKGVEGRGSAGLTEAHHAVIFRPLAQQLAGLNHWLREIRSGSSNNTVKGVRNLRILQCRPLAQVTRRQLVIRFAWIAVNEINPPVAQ